MNFLDYLVNAMTGGQPTEQELMARQMAKQGLLSGQKAFFSKPCAYYCKFHKNRGLIKSVL